MRFSFRCFVVFVLLLAGTSPGCTSSSRGKGGVDLSPEIVAKVKRGMTEREVRGLLGEPTKKTLMAEGRFMWAYRFLRGDAGGRAIYRSVPPDRPYLYDGAVFILFGAEKTVMRVEGGEIPR